MAVSVNSSLQNKSPYANDYYYCQPNSSDPWTSIEDAHENIPEAYRGNGKKFLVIVDGKQQEYWYEGGILIEHIKKVVDLSTETFGYVQPDESGNLII